MPPAAVLAIAVSAISAAAVLVRLAPDASPVALAFWRTAAVALLLAPSLLRPTAREELRALPRSQAALMVLAGVFLAGHFWTWFASLQHTTVLRSTLLVCLSPLWAGIIGWIWLGERPSRGFFGGIAAAVLGVGVMSGGVATGGDWMGDLLALVGGLLAAVYLTVGRKVRARVSIAPYGAIVCGCCALSLLPAAAATGAPLLGFSTGTWLAIAGMALGPQLLGHIGLNYAVRFLPAATVTAVVLLEPVGAAALGALVLGELPAAREWAGAGVVLVGVALATWPRRKPDPSR